MTILNKLKNNTEEEEQVDDLLNKLQKHEKQEQKSISTRVNSELQKAQSVRMQKKVCDQVLQQRILTQRPMSLL
jgi:hypothetical protein